MIALIAFCAILLGSFGVLSFFAGAMSDVPKEGADAAGRGVIMFTVALVVLAVLAVNHFHRFLPLWG